MDPERKNRASDLHHRALECPVEQRSAFLLNACAGDEALREEIESLLRYERSAASFLERPVAQAGGMATDATVNRQLGPYTILAPLGAGGMGEVYRAYDSTLGRNVAVKILPPHVTADPERRARFAREARLFASLNHPNIGAIYGLEDINGTSALVLELIDGPTLADRLARAPLTLRAALTLARRSGRPGRSAPEGIIHRDLKPSNILLQGWSAEFGAPPAHARARVVDFGLAKPNMAGADAAGSGALTHPFADTEMGRILGTPPT